MLTGSLNPLSSSAKTEKASYSKLVQNIESDNVKSIIINRNKSTAKSTLKSGDTMLVSNVSVTELDKLITSYITEKPGELDVTYDVSNPSGWTSALMALISIGLLGFLVFVFFSQQGGGGNKVMTFGKSKAKLYTKSDKQYTFADVAGADEEKEELAEVVDFLKSPRRYIDLGARIPKGVLLVGPPGTGKTLLAKATAGEAKVPFFSISGSDFVEMFVGVGASRVRDLFETAKKNSPCIVFIDEIDAVGRHRGAGLGGGNDEREQTLNQLLVEMDGFSNQEGIIIIAATNRADILDPAILRPGRFDRQVMVAPPDVKGREDILKVHSKGKPLADDIDLSIIAKSTAGFTGADLENVMNEASLLAARKREKKVSMKDIEEAIKRVIAGPEKKSKVITDEDKKITAAHEAGHAVVMKSLPQCDEVREISIIPRGMAAGYTISLPDNDNSHMPKGKLLDLICGLLGGRAAEEVLLDDICTGASNDIERASKIARSMVTEWGMSELLGPLGLGSGQDDVFIGRDFLRSKNYGEEVASAIDKEVRDIINECHEKAINILKEHKDKLELVTNELIKKETLTGEEFASLYETGKYPGEAEEAKDKEENKDEQ
ncbi:ATP-dependent metallopeptidase HflB [Anaerofustis stercorihominis DSM 17244]|uniref:ATP-dependent zinc metalloprotease FtsH n=4 Tax=Anaerofustis stercorihominis TaxID=214853 RepID=B1C981_9FIRM|nr:ATP-dependent metallopeptidase HflB [Anaerofustis stercorihominis DSM 17244]RGD73256.1 ATP-dependent metallopeptidase FtsH/Yme1/Tma family protein [Anaerofustis stercorihominis]